MAANCQFYGPKTRNQKSVMPTGLGDLMSDISREVLRKQPTNAQMYRFIAEYLDALLTTRNKATVAVDALNEILKSSLVIGELLKRNGIDFKKASEAARVIQDSFRNYVKKKEKDAPAAHKAAFDEFEIFKELVLKCNFKENEIVTVKGAIRVAFRDFFRKYSGYLQTAHVCGHDVLPSVDATLKHYADLVPSREKLNESATKIQAYYRRYSTQNKTRQKFSLYDGKFLSRESDSALLEKKGTAASIIQRVYRLYKNQEEKAKQLRQQKTKQKEIATQKMNKVEAATKIQATFRGYKVRKAMRCVEELGIPTKYKYSSLATYSQREFQRTLHKAISHPPAEQHLRDKTAEKIEKEFRKLLAEKKIEAMNKAATRIQELFRKARRMRESTTTVDEKIDRGIDEAVRIIQAAWRDYTARRSFIKEIYSGDVLSQMGASVSEISERLVTDITNLGSSSEKNIMKHVSILIADTAEDTTEASTGAAEAIGIVKQEPSESNDVDHDETHFEESTTTKEKLHPVQEELRANEAATIESGPELASQKQNDIVDAETETLQEETQNMPIIAANNHEESYEMKEEL